jgi:hypothetical protein
VQVFGLGRADSFEVDALDPTGLHAEERLMPA